MNIQKSSTNQTTPFKAWWCIDFLIVIILAAAATSFALIKKSNEKKEAGIISNELVGFWTIAQFTQELSNNSNIVSAMTANTTARDLIGEVQIMEFTTDGKLCYYNLVNSVFTTQANRCLDYTYTDGRIVIAGKGSSGSNEMFLKNELVESTSTNNFESGSTKITIRFKKIAQPTNILIPEYP